MTGSAHLRRVGFFTCIPSCTATCVNVIMADTTSADYHGWLTKKVCQALQLYCRAGSQAAATHINSPCTVEHRL